MTIEITNEIALDQAEAHNAVFDPSTESDSWNAFTTDDGDVIIGFYASGDVFEKYANQFADDEDECPDCGTVHKGCTRSDHSDCGCPPRH